MGAYTAIVLGGGIFGLSTAYHLLRREAGPLALIDQFSIGNTQGSSHGAIRIARAIYENPDYALLYQIGRNED